MQFHFIIADEVDLGFLHETLLHLLTEHPPIIFRITVEFESVSHLLESSTPEPPVNSVEEEPDSTVEDQPMDRQNFEEE